MEICQSPFLIRSFYMSSLVFCLGKCSFKLVWNIGHMFFCPTRNCLYKFAKGSGGNDQLPNIPEGNMKTGWWFGTCFIFHFIYGIYNPSQVTFTPWFFRGVGQPPTRNDTGNWCSADLRRSCGPELNMLASRWCPQTIAKLVQITPISLCFIGDISIVNGVYKPIYN